MTKIRRALERIALGSQAHMIQPIFLRMQFSFDGFAVISATEITTVSLGPQVER